MSDDRRDIKQSSGKKARPNISVTPNDARTVVRREVRETRAGGGSENEVNANIADDGGALLARGHDYAVSKRQGAMHSPSTIVFKRNHGS